MTHSHHSPITEKQITAAPLLVLAHTAKHPERRAWLKASLAEDSTGYFATDLSDDYAHWDMLIDPVEAVAVPARSWAQLHALDENDHRTRIDWRGNVWRWDDPGWRNDEHGWRELLTEIETNPDFGELSILDEQENNCE